jgi:hypothetical protein
MAEQVVLAIDIVLAFLIGPPGHRLEQIYFDRCEAGEWEPVLLDLALFCAMSSVQPGDRVDHARFARFLRYVRVQRLSVRGEGEALTPPSQAEIDHWRAVVFQQDD